MKNEYYELKKRQQFAWVKDEKGEHYRKRYYLGQQCKINNLFCKQIISRSW